MQGRGTEGCAGIAGSRIRLEDAFDVLAAAGWLLAFGLLAWRVIPLLLAPRIDGREH